MAPRRRHTPAGSGDESRDASAHAARRAWLSQLKEQAVGRLPSSASAAVRARLRQDVEHALRHHGLDDPEPEIQDIVSTLVTEAGRQVTETEEQARRAERKAELMTFARWILAAVLQRCPPHLVGSLGSDKRARATRAVWADLRTVLDKGLSGAESEDDVRGRVDTYVAQWRREHDRWWHLRPPSPQGVTKGIQLAKAAVEAVNNTPELRQLADTVVQVVRTKLQQRRQRKEPPPGPPS
jgi:hypothetical protein